MGKVLKTGVSPQTSGLANTYNSAGSFLPGPQIAKVYGVITTENTPSKEAYEANGGPDGIGTIFYKIYNEQTKDINEVTDYIKECKPARPILSNMQDYPLPLELVYLIDGPSPDSQLTPAGVQKYYLCAINLFNTIQQNAPTATKPSKTTFKENDVRNLQAFDGDRIHQGRKGNGIRFGSTVKRHSKDNEWSSGPGEDGDPITIMVNGYVTSDPDASLNIEEINKEKSSIYMTSTQAIPLKPGSNIVNPQLNTIKPSNYYSSQLIFNSDRITLNSKKDEVLVFAKTNIELTANNTINLNTGRIIHLNAPMINLGTQKNGDYPIEPAILGTQLTNLLDQLFVALSTLSGYLAATTMPAEVGGMPISNINFAGKQLCDDIDRLYDSLGKIQSDKIFLT